MLTIRFKFLYYFLDSVGLICRALLLLSIKSLGKRATFFLQAQNYTKKLDRNKSFLYLAIFDKVDEGTAFFKAAANQAAALVNPKLVTMDVDEFKVPNGWYLNLAGQVTTQWRDTSPPPKSGLYSSVFKSTFS